MGVICLKYNPGVNEIFPSDTYEVLLDDNRIMIYYLVISHKCLKLTGKYVLSV